MSWTTRHGIKIWAGETFPEPTDEELAPYEYDTPTPLQPCGTYAAYQRHRRHNETPCTNCVEANYLRGWRNRLGEQGAA